jgi:hypothetical protein
MQGFLASYRVLAEFWNLYTVLSAFLDLEIPLDLRKKISYLLIVNFQETYWKGTVLQTLNTKISQTEFGSVSKHRVSFSGTSHSISKAGNVETLLNLTQGWLK